MNNATYVGTGFFFVFFLMIMEASVSLTTNLRRYVLMSVVVFVVYVIMVGTSTMHSKMID